MDSETETKLPEAAEPKPTNRRWVRWRYQKLTKVKRKAKAKRPGNRRPLTRTSRMDIRLTPREHNMLRAKAKALRRTATSLVVELIEKLNAKR